MLIHVCRALVLAVGLLVMGNPLLSQTGSISGKVVGEDGNPLPGALIKIERLDIKGNYKVKSNKKGEFFHAGLPLGQYRVTLSVNDRDRDMVSGLRVGMSDTTEVNFDLKELADRQQQRQQQAATGEVSDEQLRGMSEEERKKYEEVLKNRREQLSKNKELNESFNSGMEALRANDFQGAVTGLGKAAEIDPQQPVVWANLAEAQSKLSQSKTGDERSQLTEQSIDSYRKAIALQPENAAFYNNLGLALVRAGKLEEGTGELTKAAELDPANGGRYYFNLGAIMVNTGNTQGAIDAFRRATELDPSYAPAHYQLGTALVGAAEMNDDGSIKPVAGTVEAFQRYLQLDPNGESAPAAQAMIQSLTGTVDTKYQDPGAKKKK